MAYFGEASNRNRYKQYHILIEAIDGTYDLSAGTPVPGSNYSGDGYSATTWSNQNTAGSSVIEGQEYYEISSEPVISNLNPQYQLGWDLDGYDLIYSCYDPIQRDNPDISGQKDYHIYFFYRPKQYKLTFMYTGGQVTDTYYYTQSLENALQCTEHDHSDPEKTGYEFKGWYTNESGAGARFEFTGTSAQRMPSHNIVLYPRMDIIQYMVKIDPNGGVIDHINYSDPDSDQFGNYANNFGVTGSGHNESQATYFTADYGTPIGAYTGTVTPASTVPLRLRAPTTLTSVLTLA